MRNSSRLSPRLAIAALGVTACALHAAPQPAEETAPEPLDPHLIEARKVLVLDTTMNFSLASSFLGELEEWNRFEIVYTPDEADVCMALSTRPDYTKEAIDSGGETDEDDPLSGRTIGTTRVMNTLYFKVFIPGGDELWIDEVELDGDGEEAKTLIERLRKRMDEELADEAATG